MNFLPPSKIFISSDNNELVFIKIINQKKGEALYQYEFSKSKTKLGMLVEFTEDNLKRNLSNTFKVL